LAAWAVLLCACGGGDGGVTCTPPPTISSTPPTVASVGQQYGDVVQALYVCGFLPFPCGDFNLVISPPGTQVDMALKYIYWTPTSEQANTDVRFRITVGPDACGDSTSQSWTVRVLP
jgi:hypothetical protein